MDVFQSPLAGSTVAQVPEQQFGGERNGLLRKVRVMELFGRIRLEGIMHRFEDFGDSPRPFGPFTEDKFVAGRRV